jgi:hypothetical protein
MSQKEPPEEFTCHPECLKRSYWRKVLVEIEEEIVGLRPGQLTELVLAVLEAERDEWKRDQPATSIGRKGAIQMYLRSWDPPDIDSLFGFEHGATDKVIADAQIHPRAQDVVAAHLEGASPAQISRECRIGIAAVISLLESIGEEPHRVRDLTKSAHANRTILRLYDDLKRNGSKQIYKQIAARLDMPEHQVRSRLAYARRTGRLSDPPLPNSNIRRRKPRAAQ